MEASTLEQVPYSVNFCEAQIVAHFTLEYEFTKIYTSENLFTLQSTCVYVGYGTLVYVGYGTLVYVGYGTLAPV